MWDGGWVKTSAATATHRAARNERFGSLGVDVEDAGRVRWLHPPFARASPTLTGEEELKGIWTF